MFDSDSSLSKFAAYLREREGFELMEIPEGFAVFRIWGCELYIRDIFIYPEFRKSGIAAALADSIVESVKSKCPKVGLLTGTVSPKLKSATDSMKVLLAYGMTIHSSSEEAIIFKKEI